jgi:hypothetical protein
LYKKHDLEHAFCHVLGVADFGGNNYKIKRSDHNELASFVRWFEYCTLISCHEVASPQGPLVSSLIVVIFCGAIDDKTS